MISTHSRFIVIGVAALLLVGVSAGVWWFAPKGPVAYQPVGAGDTYLALGDSLAWGAQLADPQRESYPALLRARLFTTGSQPALVNISVPGATSGSLRRQQLPRAVGLIEQARAAGQRVSPITIDIGGNDLLAAQRGDTTQRTATIAAAQANITATLDALREATDGDADIVIMAYYNPYGGDPQQPDSEAAWVIKMNDMIRAVAEPRGVAVADAYTPFEGGRAYALTNIVLGDFHANREGHIVMADAFWQALQYK